MNLALLFFEIVVLGIILIDFITVLYFGYAIIIPMIIGYIKDLIKVFKK